MRAAGSALVLLLLLAGCSAGRAPGDPLPTAAAALADGHGSVAEVLFALEAQGLPCTGEQAQPPTAQAEEVCTCTLRGEPVTVVHFVDVAQAEAYRASVDGEGLHGAFSTTWALRTASAEVAEDVATALRADSRL